MPERIHLVLSRLEKERYRRLAAREGKTLSEWLRAAAREKLAKSEEVPRLATERDLEAFFSACDEAESGVEPNWETHRRVIEESIRRGGSSP